MSRRWAIMGTGRVAGLFARAIRAEGSEVMAVGSGNAARAAAFAARHGIVRHAGRHHAVLDVDEVDVVYVATTNERHHLDAHACIEAGLPVLVEKPFAVDLARAEAVLAAARARAVFVMEAMWMHLQPGIRELERRVAAGQIGEPRMLTADFGLARAIDPTRRWYAPDRGGGALLAVGSYPLSLAIALLGEPVKARTLVERASTGVDTQAAVAMRHRSAMSSWVCSLGADSGAEASVAGPEGSLHVHTPFHNPSRLTRRVAREIVEEIEVPGADLGYRYEVREVERCLADGALESPTVPWERTLLVQRWLDILREQGGIAVPADA